MAAKLNVYDKIEVDEVSSPVPPLCPPTSHKQFNVLLLGETGVGKSTFINAFANYISHSTLLEAEKDETISLIPTKFTVTNENFEECTIEFGKSENECQEVGASATQNAKSYIFWVGDEVSVRLIDTPGIGDTRGADQDNINFDNVLTCLGEFKELHAICILLKPNNARISVMFEYCIKQLLCRLEKSASKNIIFIFTNSRSTFYRPGDTLPALRKILGTTEERPPYVKIPLDKSNVFCIDNEAFRFLIALVNKVKFDQREREDFAASWNKSAEECMRLLTYITELIPHQIQNTISVNEARRLIVQLSRPLADIANMIQINIEQLQRQEKLIGAYSNDVESLKKNMYIPVTNIRVEELPQPRTVCTEVKCCDVYQINGNKAYHYRQRCHDPCYLKNVPKEIVGSPELMQCAAMGAGNMCKQCGCSYHKHMHIYYVSTPYEDNIVDENIKTEITTKEKAKSAAEEMIRNLKKRCQEYEYEQDVITKSNAKFAHFLQNNALTTYNNAYEAYLRHLIDRENSMGEGANQITIKHYEKMLQDYAEEKKVLDKALDLVKQQDKMITSYVSAKDIMETIQQLYHLPRCGAKIKELYEKQNRAKVYERAEEQEVVYKSGTSKKIFNYLKKKVSAASNYLLPQKHASQ